MLPAESGGRPVRARASRSSTCSTWSRPASARATCPSACRCSSRPCRRDTPFRADALTTVRTISTCSPARDFAKLKKLLRCNDDVLRGVQSLIISLNPRPGAGFSKQRSALYRARCHRQEGQGPVARGAQSRRHAEAAHQPHVCRHPPSQPRREPAAARRPAAGGEVADQERAAALRHHPARVAGHRRPPAAFLRARRGGDAPAGAARDRRHARPARVHRCRASRRRSSCSRRAASSS